MKVRDILEDRVICGMFIKLIKHDCAYGYVNINRQTAKWQ
jgi:hypothetical protein